MRNQQRLDDGMMKFDDKLRLPLFFTHKMNIFLDKFSFSKYYL